MWNSLSDIGMSWEHMSGRTKYHGEHCMWCAFGTSKQNQKESHQHPSALDFRTNKIKVTKKSIVHW